MRPLSGVRSYLRARAGESAKYALVLLLAACTWSSGAGEAPAAAGDVDELIASAQPGDVVKLPAGSLGLVTIRERSWSRPLTVDARKSRLRMVLDGVHNLHILGGTYADANDTGRGGYALSVENSSGIRIQDARFTNATRGLVVGRSEDLVLQNLEFVDMRAEGINLGLSRRVKIRGVRCSRFNPVPPDHPDCIQAWSRPSAPPSADIEVSDVFVEGSMQGVFFGNHVRNGVDDGGFDRITIRRDHVTTSFTNAIALFDCRNCTIVDNVAWSLPNGFNSALVRVSRCADCTVQNNIQKDRKGFQERKVK